MTKGEVVRLVVVVAALISAPAQAQDLFPITITNTSSRTWGEGVLAVLPEGGEDSLIAIGQAPSSGDHYDTYLYLMRDCDVGGEDDGDAELLINRFSTLQEDVNAWVVPQLSPGQDHTVLVEAVSGDVMSYVSRIPNTMDDFVMMHVPGDVDDVTVDLYSDMGLPLWNPKYDTGGYDANTLDETNGNGASCSTNNACPPIDGCYVANGTGTVGADAGGDMPLPPDPNAEWVAWPGYVLEAEAGTFTQNGIGAPTVVYREVFDDYVMFFESRLPQSDPECPQGVWGIGVATSVDAWNWTVESNIIAPAENSYYGCVAAHPVAVIDEGGRDIHLWFKAEQENTECSGSQNIWSCMQTGVGYARVDEGLTSATVTTDPIIEVSGFGYPGVVHHDGTWTMMIAKTPDFYRATSVSPDSGWVLDEDPVMSPGVTSWTQDELFNPSLVCNDEESFPYELFFGGRNLVGFNIDLGGWGKSISDDFLTWWIASDAYFTWFGNSQWRHWDTVRVGDEYVVYYSEKDTQGRNRIGIAGTSDQVYRSDILTRICPQPTFSGSSGGSFPSKWMPSSFEPVRSLRDWSGKRLP